MIMTPEEIEQMKQMKELLQNDLSDVQGQLKNLIKGVNAERDEAEKRKNEEEIKKLEERAAALKNKIDTISSLSDEELQTLNEKDLLSLKNDIIGLTQKSNDEASEQSIEKIKTPTTYELLKDSATTQRLLKILSSDKFKNFKDDKWNKLETPEEKLEYVFRKIRGSIVLFMKNKLWDSPKMEYVINNTIAPAFEWSLMELLRDQWNDANVNMLQWMNNISRNGNMFLSGFNKLVKWVWNFAKKASWSYSKFSQWMNAVDYLSVHNWVLRNPNKSQVLSNPLEFQRYMNDDRFATNGFSPYVSMSDNVFKLDDNQTFQFWITPEEKQSVLNEIWNIQVVDNPRTTALIVKMLDKPEKFLWATSGLQKTANNLLDWVNSLNSVTKIFWVDILWDITKAPEKRNPRFKILDFVLKLIWITWGLEWIVKKWRLDRMDLTDEKSENISQIFEKYKELAWENVSLSVTAENCKEVLSDFAVTDSNTPSTKWDFLRDSIAENMDVSQVSPAVVQQVFWNSYLKQKEVDWKLQNELVVDADKVKDISYDQKLSLAHKHLQNMKLYLENYKDNDLSEFYTNIHSTEDLALCITASLYANQDDVIEWVKAKVFLPENYGSVRNDWTVANSWRDNLDSGIDSDKQKVSEQWICDKAREYGVTDKRQIAYILSTVKLESWFKNQKEIWWENKDYWKVDSSTWRAYYGRWFIQLTHKSNYEKYTKIINDSWMNFKDNDGNDLKWSEIDLVNNPDVILQSNELAAFILMDWMKNGWPNRVDTKKLDYYININDNKQDYYNARSIVNWMSSKPQVYASNAQTYLKKLDNGEALA